MTFNQIDDREMVPVPRRHDGSNAGGADATSAVLNQADALMRRHRVFVAGAEIAPAPSAAPAHTIPVDDLPVLTDAVDAPRFHARFSPIQAETMHVGRYAGLSHVLSQWLEEELPIEIQKLTEDLADQVVVRLTTKARTELLARVINELEK